MGGCCGWVVCSMGCAPLNGRVLPLGSRGEGSSVFVLLRLVCEGTIFSVIGQRVRKNLSVCFTWSTLY